MLPCPSREQLQALLFGQLDGSGAALVETHVQSCPLCQDVLERLTTAPADKTHELHPPAGFPLCSGAEESVVRELKALPAPPSWCAATFRREHEPSTTARTSRAPAPPPRIPGYEILGELGRGGMGIVYKAQQLRLHRLVALKMVLTGGDAGPQELARFRTEAEVAAQLQHANIVQIYEVGEHEGRPFCALEFVEGGTLADQLAGNPLPALVAAQVTEVLARAMHYAHERGVLHRDLKPANILLKDEGREARGEGREPTGENGAISPLGSRLSSLTPKISDFGLAKRLKDKGNQTNSAIVMGTPSYMAPEQAGGSARSTGPATDVYALGALLYEMLTGRPPFKGESPLDTLQLVQSVEPVPPGRLQPRVPRDLETICLKCLEKETSRRYGSALSLAEDLGHFRKGEPIAARPAAAVERTWRWCRRQPALAALLAAVALLVLVLAVGGTVAAWSLGRERDIAVKNEDRAKTAEQQATAKLWESYLAQARAGRWSGKVGRRFGGLEALTKAAEIRPALELRNEAIACMALVDIRPVTEWEINAKPLAMSCFDSSLEHYVWGDDQGTLHVHRVSDRHEILQLPGPGQPAWVVQLSANGQFLAARHHARNDSSSEFYLWDVRTHESIGGGPRKLPGLAWDFSPEGKGNLLAAAEADGTLTLYDLDAGHKRRRVASRGSLPRHVAFDPAGRRLAVSCRSTTTVHIFDAVSGKLTGSLSVPQPAHGLAWHPDGVLLACAGLKGTIFLWNTLTGKQHAALEGHQEPVVYVNFNHRGDLLVSAGWDQTIRLWNPLTGKQLVSGPGLGIPQFSRDDRRLGFLASTTKLAIWEVAWAREFRELLGYQETRGFWSVDFSPDGTLLAAAGEDGVHFWDTDSGREAGVLLLPLAVSALFQPTTGALFTSSGAGLQHWKIAPSAGSPLVHWVRALAGRESEGSRLQFQQLPAPRLEAGPVGRLALAGDGKAVPPAALAVVRLPPMQAAALVFRGEKLADQVPLGRHDQTSFVALSPRGEFAATGTWHGAGVKVWDARTGKLMRAWPEEDAFVAFDSQSRWLVTGTAREYRFWTVASWEPGLRIPRNAVDTVGPLAFSPDGKLLAIAHSPWEIRLIDADTGRELATLSSPSPRLIAWLCFSPDGKQLAAACNNQTVHLWNLDLIRSRLEQMRLGF